MSQQQPSFNRRPKGFSLIELVIVVVIIGIIAAIAIPKMSKGAAGAGDSALQGNLAVIRNAIELYNSEHGKFPSGTATVVEDQLTKYTDSNGGFNATKSKDVAAGYAYGPYLRKLPVLPVGQSTKKGKATIKVITGTSIAPTSDVEAWIYNSDTGDVIANLETSNADNKDAGGKNYSEY
jgi:prepilin-type N-terminal cleavage/methylation domain-containing protein